MGRVGDPDGSWAWSASVVLSGDWFGGKAQLLTGRVRCSRQEFPWVVAASINKLLPCTSWTVQQLNEFGFYVLRMENVGEDRESKWVHSGYLVYRPTTPLEELADLKRAP